MSWKQFHCRSAPKLSKPHYHPPPVLHPKSHLFWAGSGSESKSSSSSSSSSSSWSWWPSPSWCYHVLPLSLSGNSSSPAVPLQNDLLHLLDLRFHRIIPHPFAEAGLHKGHDENQSCSAQILGLQWDSMGLKDTLLNITTIVLVLVLKTTRSRFGLAKTYLLVGLSHHPPQKTRYAIVCRKLRSEHSAGVFVEMDKFAELWSFAHTQTHTILCQHDDWKRMSCNLIICVLVDFESILSDVTSHPEKLLSFVRFDASACRFVNT